MLLAPTPPLCKGIVENHCDHIGVGVNAKLAACNNILQAFNESLYSVELELEQSRFLSAGKVDYSSQGSHNDNSW